MSWIGMLLIRELFGLEESIFIPAMTGDGTRIVENFS